MQRFGFSLQERYSLPTTQVLDLLADTGFCAVSPQWLPDGSPEETVRLARERNLTVQSLHGPLRGMPAAWSQDPEIARPIRQDLLQSAMTCSRLEIPILVIHPWNGVDYHFQPETLCFDHFDALVALAETERITVAFENLEGPEFLAALMERYAGSSAVGFCWDSGHEQCYTPGMDLLAPYRDRLIMTHLNDNFGVTDPQGRLQGSDDLHLLPFDGITDWPHVINRLKQSKHQEILNFEFKIRPKGDRCKTDLYSKIPLEQYIAQAYIGASRIAAKYFKF